MIHLLLSSSRDRLLSVLGIKNVCLYVRMPGLLVTRPQREQWISIRIMAFSHVPLCPTVPLNLLLRESIQTPVFLTFPPLAIPSPSVSSSPTASAQKPPGLPRPPRAAPSRRQRWSLRSRCQPTRRRSSRRPSRPPGRRQRPAPPAPRRRPSRAPSAAGAPAPG